MNKNINILFKLRLIGVLSTFVLFSFYVNSQFNLVPNPSFEIFDTCPKNELNPPYSGVNAICLAIPWFQPNSPNHFCSGSSDFFHQCANSVPQNIVGFQYARTGSGYAGAGITDNPNLTGGEYLEVELINNMERKKYCVSYFIRTTFVDWSSTNCIQARFTKDSVISNSFDRIYLSDGVVQLI